MAQRGRPKVTNREQENFPMSENVKLSMDLISNGDCDRSKTNAYYTYYAMWFYKMLATKGEENSIPYFDKLPNCILEQIGRMLMQDHFNSDVVFTLACWAGEAYNGGDKAKDVAASIREWRMENRSDDTLTHKA